MLLIALALFACSGDDATDTPSDVLDADTDADADADADADSDSDADTDTDTEAQLPAVEVVQLQTIDGVALEGDLYGQPTPGTTAGVCLLHMIPPSNDRTGWPVDFIEALRAQGWGVLALDRRGAGESDGMAADAYGEPGKYDTEACVRELTDRNYGPVAVIGASNGTTAMIDYAVWALDQQDGIPVAAMGFMTGGTYTESQTPMEDVPAVPAIFTYSADERAWSVDQQGLQDEVWVFEQYADGDHGTRMFDAQPQVSDDLVAFFASVL